MQSANNLKLKLEEGVRDGSLLRGCITQTTYGKVHISRCLKHMVSPEHFSTILKLVVSSESHGVSWCLMVSHDVSWCLTVSHGVSWCLMVSHGVPWCLMVSRGVSWCLVVSHGVS